MATRRKHFVTFYSPGTFVSEESTRPIEEWDTVKACRMAKGVTERYGAKPFGFRFSTCIVSDPVSDGEGGELAVQAKEVQRSGIYHLGGTLLTYDDVNARARKGDEILLGNMRSHSPIVVENANSWRSTTAFNEEDVLLDPETGELMERGSAPHRMAYRKKVRDDYDAEMKQRFPQLK